MPNKLCMPSSYDRSILCQALDEFVVAPKMDNVPKWKKSQLNSQAIVVKNKLKNLETGFDARDFQAMLAATMLSLKNLEQIKEPDKETTRKINACTRNLNFCKEYFDNIPI